MRVSGCRPQINDLSSAAFVTGGPYQRGQYRRDTGVILARQ